MAITTVKEAQHEAEVTLERVDERLLALTTQESVVSRDVGRLRSQRNEVGRWLTRFWFALYRNEPETVRRALDMVTFMATVSRVLSRRNDVQRRIDSKHVAVEATAGQVALIEPKLEQAKKDLEALEKSQEALEASKPFMLLYRLWQEGKYSATLERPHVVLWWLMCFTVIPRMIWNYYARLRESQVTNALLEARDYVEGFDGKLPSCFEAYDRMPRKASDLLATVRAHGVYSKAHARHLGELETLHKEKAGIERELEVAAETDISLYFVEQAPTKLTARMVATWPEEAKPDGFRFVILTRQIESLEAAAAPVKAKIAHLGKYRETVARAKRRWDRLSGYRVLDRDVTQQLVTHREALLRAAERERGRCHGVYDHYLHASHAGLDDLIEQLVDAGIDVVDAAGGPEALIDEAIAGVRIAEGVAQEAVDIVAEAANDVAEVSEGVFEAARDAAERVADAMGDLVDDFASLEEVGVEGENPRVRSDDDYGERGADHTDDAGGSTGGWGSSGGGDSSDRDEVSSSVSNDRASDPPPDTSGGSDGDAGGGGGDSSSGGDD